MPPRLIGKRIKQAREERELTQEALARRARISRIYVAKLEAGERTAPSLAVLERVARALGLQLVDLLK